MEYPRMRGDSRGGRTQEVIGSIPISSTKIQSFLRPCTQHLSAVKRWILPRALAQSRTADVPCSRADRRAITSTGDKGETAIANWWIGTVHSPPTGFFGGRRANWPAAQF